MIRFFAHLFLGLLVGGLLGGAVWQFSHDHQISAVVGVSACVVYWIIALIVVAWRNGHRPSFDADVFDVLD